MELEAAIDTVGRDTRRRKAYGAGEPGGVKAISRYGDAGRDGCGFRARRPAIDVILNALSVEGVVGASLGLIAVVASNADFVHIGTRRRVGEGRGQGAEI